MSEAGFDRSVLPHFLCDKYTSSLVATGVYIMPRRVFPLLSEYCATAKRDNMGSFIARLVQVDRVDAYSFTKTWIDIGEKMMRELQAATP